MEERKAAEYWERNAPAWTLLVRQGWDLYRDVINTPAFLAILPDITGKTGLDIGCGEGHNTRLLAQRGARLSAVDVSPTFVRMANAWDGPGRGEIRYVQASATRLPFADGSFDFATSFMCLMDLPDQLQALREAHRVLQPGGFLQFSIVHPCFNLPHRRLLRDAEGLAYAVEIGRYFERSDGRLERWIFGAAPAEVRQGLPPFEVPLFHRTLSDWLNSIVLAGFILEHAAEPYADSESAKRVPHVQDTQVVSYFLHLRCRKPA
jgi:SAM-dependent methyltransferase